MNHSYEDEMQNQLLKSCVYERYYNPVGIGRSFGKPIAYIFLMFFLLLYRAFW